MKRRPSRPPDSPPLVTPRRPLRSTCTGIDWTRSVSSATSELIAVVRAALLHRTGTAALVDQARASVPDLLRRAAPQRLLSTIAIGAAISPGFAELLAPYAQAPDAPAFAAEAYAAVGRVPPAFPGPVSRRPGTGGVDGEATTGLTPREREVLGQLALGGGNADLARSLFVSENTVKTHLASIYRKLGVDRRLDALRVARARGLL